MRPEHVGFLRCPQTGGQLECVVQLMEGEHVMRGKLVAPGGTAYPIVGGVPDFRPAEVSKRQKDSELSFGQEWQVFSREGWDSRVKNERLHFYNYTRLIPSFLHKKKNSALQQNLWVPVRADGRVDRLKSFPDGG